MATATTYQLNEKRRREEFRPVLFTSILTLHALAIGAIVWHATAWFWPSWTVIGIAVGLYVFTGLFGIAMGYHRYFTHQGYECGPVLKAVMLIAGAVSAQGEIFGWLRTHVRHHANADKPGDAHSPYQYGGTLWLTLKGIMWAHAGWLFYDYELPERTREDKFDRDPLMQLQRKHYDKLLIAGLVLPAIVCGIVGLASGGLHGLWVEALDGFLAQVVRLVLLLNVTWCINSVCHLWGEQLTISVMKPNAAEPKVYYPADGSRNAFGLAAFSFGEAKHTLHHRFPYIAYMAWNRWGVDPAKWTLIVFEKFGWVWDVKKPPEFEVEPLEIRLPEDSFISAVRELKEERKLSLAA
jgi:stearoyl-CoA desaturase (delta-9 desaturase)